jgi:Fe2+ or Zn2+ uptake regulation protein
MDTLNQQSQPLSAQALYDVMRQQQVIGLATVYRALETFEKMARLHLERMAEGPQPNSMMSRLDWSSTW